MNISIKELVAAGHQLSKRLGEPDAAVVSQLATQLDVQAALVKERTILNYDPTDPDKMRLPTGVTCGNCHHIRRCKAIYGHTESDTYCDWSPSRFVKGASA